MRSECDAEAWLNSGVLIQDSRPALYPYMSYEHNGKIFIGAGFFALVETLAVWQGHVIPHEKTYANPIEDRLKLMRSTRCSFRRFLGCIAILESGGEFAL